MKKKLALLICLALLTMTIYGCTEGWKVKPIAEQKKTGGPHDETDSLIGLGLEKKL